jgi:drug/metabolite transporter (DMT)-like permease
VTTTAPRRALANHSDLRLGLGAMAVAITAWGLTGVLIKSIDMDPIAVAFWRFGVYALLFSAWVRARGGRIDLEILRRTMPGGLCLAADVMLFFTAVKHTNVVNATTIGALQPLLLGLVATRLFGERIRMREVAAAVVAIAGVVVIVVQSAGTPEWSPAGDLAAVGALFAWSAYWIFAKRADGSITPMEYTAGTGWWTAIAALPVGLLVGHDMSVPALSSWVPLAALILVGGVLGHGMMNWAIVRVPLWLGSTLTLLIPVISSLAAWLFLDETLTVVQLAAMAVVVAALTAIVVGQQQPAPAPEPA